MIYGSGVMVKGSVVMAYGVWFRDEGGGVHLSCAVYGLGYGNEGLWLMVYG